MILQDIEGHSDEMLLQQKEIALLIGKLANNSDVLVKLLIEKVNFYINEQEKYIADIEMSILQHYHLLCDAEKNMKIQEQETTFVLLTKDFIEKMPYFKSTAREIKEKMRKEIVK